MPLPPQVHFKVMASSRDIGIELGKVNVGKRGHPLLMSALRGSCQIGFVDSILCKSEPNSERGGAAQIMQTYFMDVPNGKRQVQNSTQQDGGCHLVQGWAKLPFPGLVNFVPAVAYHFCLILPENFSQPGNGILAQPCR